MDEPTSHTTRIIFRRGEMAGALRAVPGRAASALDDGTIGADRGAGSAGAGGLHDRKTSGGICSRAGAPGYSSDELQAVPVTWGI